MEPRTAILGALTTLVLCACGGGSGSVAGWVDFFGGTTKTTSAESTSASGNAFVPAGAQCHPAGGILGPPFCYCEAGDSARLTWSNAANGTSGTGNVSLAVANSALCTPEGRTFWYVADIPLAMGVNVVTVTLSDDSSSGTAKLTVTRN